MRLEGSFDCVVARFAGDNFAQDDTGDSLADDPTNSLVLLDRCVLAALDVSARKKIGGCFRTFFRCSQQKHVSLFATLRNAIPIQI